MNWWENDNDKNTLNHDDDLESVYTLKKKIDLQKQPHIIPTMWHVVIWCTECEFGISRNRGPSQAAVNHSKFILCEVRMSIFPWIIYPTDFGFEIFPIFSTCPQTSKLEKVTCLMPKFPESDVGFPHPWIE